MWLAAAVVGLLMGQVLTIRAVGQLVLRANLQGEATLELIEANRALVEELQRLGGGEE